MVSALEDFHDAVRVNANIFPGVGEVKQQVVILARAKVTAGLEMVFRSVVQADDERPERLALHHAFKFLDFHAGTVAGVEARTRLNVCAAPRSVLPA